MAGLQRVSSHHDRPQRSWTLAEAPDAAVFQKKGSSDRRNELSNAKCACWALERGQFGEGKGFCSFKRAFLGPKSGFFTLGETLPKEKSPHLTAKRRPPKLEDANLSEKMRFFVGMSTSEAREGVLEPSPTAFKRRWGVRRGMEGSRAGNGVTSKAWAG
jgi:hypothetical protein